MLNIEIKGKVKLCFDMGKAEQSKPFCETLFQFYGVVLQLIAKVTTFVIHSEVVPSPHIVEQFFFFFFSLIVLTLNQMHGDKNFLW